MEHFMTSTLALLGLFFACSDKGTDSGLPVGDSGDTGATGSTCGHYFSADFEGSQWQWTLDGTWSAKNETTGGWQVDAMGSEVWDGILVWMLQEELDFEVDGWSTWEEQVRYRFHCDEQGAWLTQFEGVYQHENDLYEESDWWAGDFEEPQLFWPADIAPGDSWEIDTSYLLTYSGSQGVTLPLGVSFNAVGSETVTVAAGTYEAIEIDVAWTGDPRREFTNHSYTTWVAPQVGEVKVEGYAELTQFELDPQFQTE